MPPARKPTRLFVALLLAVAVLLTFLPTLHHGFVNYDDPEYVFENPEVLGGLSPAGLVWAFTTYHAANWHPLTWLSHQADATLWGAHPAGHHLTSVLLHAAAACGLFLLLEAACGGLLASAFAAALFALHPLHVESVAWVAERKDVLAGFFWFLFLGAWLRHLRRPSIGRFMAAGLVLALGLMAKPMLVTLPLVLLILDWWPLGRLKGIADLKRLAVEKAPFLLLAAVSGAVTILAQGSGGAVAPLERVPFLPRLANAVLSSGVYLRQTFLPADLAVFYPLTARPDLTASAASLVLLVLAAAAAIAMRRRHPWALAGWLWYLVTLLPVLGLIQVGSQAHADRYTYIPLVGIFIVVAWSGRAAAAGGPGARRILAVFALVIVVAGGAAARRQAGYWKDTATLFDHADRVTAGNWLAAYHLGNVAAAHGRIAEAAARYGQALALRPEYPEALNNLGTILSLRGRGDEGAAFMERALRLCPDYAGAAFNLGYHHYRAGDYRKAVEYLDRTLAIRPDFPEAARYRDQALDLLGREAR
jgi:tetratricopeptide (TPR) repeat protein